MTNRLTGILLLLLLTAMLGSCNKPADQDAGGDAGTAAAPTGTQHAVAPVSGSVDDTAIPANPCAAPPAGEGLRLRGELRKGENGLLFTPCNSSQAVPMQDSEIGLLAGLIEQLGDETGSIYIQMDGNSDGSTLSLKQLWRASPVNDSFGCRENQTGLLYLARGNEPFWGVEVRDTGKIALLLPGDDGAGVREILYDYTTTEQIGPELIISGINPDTQAAFSLTLRKVPSIDSMSGEWFGMHADMRYADVAAIGTAWPGEASDFKDQS
jgi:uncharacterized membrane protein